MDFQDHSQAIQWRIHLKSAPERVYEFLSTDEGRAKFWAESAREANGHIHFQFPDDLSWDGKILEAHPPSFYRVVYYGGSTTTFQLTEAPHGGTDLLLTDEGVEPQFRCEVTAGWVSVLMALKAAADYGADLRNHDPQRTWNQGYADN
jgi:uncharacterized protein YndB with AHSA1/START domain